MEATLRARPQAPDYWTSDMHQYIEMLRRASKRSDHAVPLDLVQGRSGEEARQLGQTLVLRFGQLLSSRDAIIGAAKRLKARGVTLAEPI